MTTHHEKRPRLKAYSLDQFLDREIPPRKMLLSPCIAEKSIAMLFGSTGVGKSLLAIEMGLTVAGGGDLLGWKASSTAPVVYIDAEMAAADMQARVKAVVRRRKAERPLSEDFRVISADLQRRGIRDLSTDEGQEDLDEVIEDAKFVILDNLSTLCRSGRENEAESWTPLQEWALRHRRDGRSIMVVHHAGKNGGQRGTSRRLDVLDTVIRLQRPDEYSQVDGARFHVLFDKARGFMGEDAEPFEARLTEDGWVRAAIGNALTDQVLELHEQKLSQREIAHRVGASAATVNRIIARSRSAS